jgi:cellulose synthase/poly-beta-1,6-N-acetylglucosamine synthase-like glycosyltransferase
MTLLLLILANISFFLLGYSYFLFPFLIKKWSKPNNDSYKIKDFPKVAIIMSAYREEGVIRAKIRSLLEQDYPVELLTIWIASDGSTDATNQIIRDEIADKAHIHFFEFTHRRGKPAVINDLVERAKIFFGQENFIIILTDANVLFRTDLVSCLIKPFIHEEISLVDARVYPLEKETKGISISENYYLLRESRLKEHEGNWGGFAMGVSGACYAIRSEAYVPVPKNFLVDDFFISFHVLLSGRKAVLFTEAICYEEVSSSINIEFKRRRRISAGNFQNLFYFIPFFSLKQFRLWFVFFSHKVIRWFGPLFILVLFFSLFLLFRNHFLFVTCMTLFLFFLFSLFAIDIILENNNIHLPILRGFRYFLVINTAVLVGWLDFLKGINSNVWEPTKRNQ